MICHTLKAIEVIGPVLQLVLQPKVEIGHLFLFYFILFFQVLKSFLVKHCKYRSRRDYRRRMRISIRVYIYIYISVCVCVCVFVCVCILMYARIG